MIVKIEPHQLSLTRTCAFAFFKESKLPGTFDWDHWRSCWGEMMEKGMAVILADMPDVHVLGVLGGIAARCLNTGDLEIFEAFWFVLPEHRKGTRGLRLLNAFENWGREIRAKRIKMAHLTDLNGNTVADMYRRMGYQEQETTYRKEL